MAYNPNAPADTQFLADFPPEMREQLRAIIEDEIVNAMKLRGLIPGNANGNIAINNGTVNTNLNADKLDGHDAAFFSADGHVHNVATQSSNGFMSNSDKKKLDGISTGAEVNQNAFGNVKIGSTTLQADAKQDTLELAAGANITLTPDQTNDKITVAAPNVLPLTGGKMTGVINSNAINDIDATSSTRIEEIVYQGLDKNDKSLGSDFFSAYSEDVFHGFRTNNPNLTSGWADIRLHVNKDAKYWAEYSAHGNQTLSIADNSNAIPTTKWISDRYLMLSGGTLTGGVKFNGTGGIPINITDTGTEYRDIQVEHTDGKRVGVIRFSRGNTENVVTIGASDAKNSAPSGLEVHRTLGDGSTDGTITVTAPTPGANDNSTKVATTAFVNTKASNYLPLAGGTMTGKLKLNVPDDLTIANNADNKILSIGGGTDALKGATLNLSGNGTITGGKFSLVANDTNQASKVLFGTARDGGSLKWDGKEIERVDTVRTNYIRYVSGLQICWGEITNITSSWKTVTYPAAFKSGTNPQVTIGQKARCYFSLNDVAYNNFKIRTDQSTNYSSCYIAIGYWK